MKIIETRLPEIILLGPQVHGDSRGFFYTEIDDPNS